jgi:replicative DNA helicase Mcm
MAQPDNTEIIDRWLEFYRQYAADDIGQLAQAYPDDRRSLYVDWQDLYRFDKDMAHDVLAKPGVMQDYAEEALRLYDLPVDVKLGRAHARFTNLPDDAGKAPGELRAKDENVLVAVDGTIASIGGVRTRHAEVAYECQRCGTLSYIPNRNYEPLGDAPEPEMCNGCENKGPFAVNHDQSESRDFQTVVLGHDPADAGDTESIEVRLTDDITDGLNAGDHVRVTGTVRSTEEGTPVKHASVNDRVLEAMSVESHQTEPHDRATLTEEEKQAIIELSNQSDLYEQLVGSLAPSVPSHENLKLALILQLFGGVPKHLPDETRIRGDIHTLAVSGDSASLARIASAASRLAPRGVEADTTGDTLLTADSDYVQARSAYRYRAGVLPRLDPDGFASLTGFTDAPSEAQEAITDVLRDQSVTVSERDAKRTMPARTSVLATGAPKYGEWDEYEPMLEQVGVGVSTLPAFDLAFTITDAPEDTATTADALQAGGMAAQKERVPISSVSDQEVDAAAGDSEPAIDPDLLQKYIAHARRSCFPTVSDDAREAITDFYVGLSDKELKRGNLPATANDLAAVVRLAEASARARLSDTVEKQDAERTINLIRASLESMGAELSGDQFNRPEEPDGQSSGGSTPDMVSTPTVGGGVDGIAAIIAELEAESGGGAPLDDVLERAVENGAKRDAASREVEQLKQRGEAYEPSQGELRLAKSDDSEEIAQSVRQRSVKRTIERLEDEYEEGVRYDALLDIAETNAIDRDAAEEAIEQLKQRGEVYEPSQGHLRTT